ncbi:MAG: SIS domain-containing protein [Candidatus Omnitrophota bacterium]
MEDKIKAILNDSSNLLQEVIKNDVGTLCKIIAIITKALQESKKIILFGNGGSAADAEHIAAEFIGRFKKNRPALPAIALSGNTPILTCLANDYGYSEVFKRQIEALGVNGDVAIGISTSGKSENVINGIIQAKKIKMQTIALTGGDGGRLGEICDIAFIVSSKDVPLVQQVHITCAHVICGMVEENIFGNAK